jgi:dTDP-glucose pyrophosphorylase
MIKSLNIIFTMAGVNKRFTDAGYNTSKYMLPLNGITIFENVLNSFLDIKEMIHTFVFVLPNNKEKIEFVTKVLSKKDISNYKIFTLDSETKGQAETALLGLKKINNSKKILIFNIDTFLINHEIKKVDFNNDNSIPCIITSGDNWSFVKINEKNIAIEVAEKRRISNLCSIGMYIFKNKEIYQKAYEETYSSKKNQAEEYIAPMYNSMIDFGLKVSVDTLDTKNVIIVGVPSEYEYYSDLFK